MDKDPFEYQRPTEAQVQQIAEVRTGCKELRGILNKLPPGREKSLAFTKLEEVSMWANKAVVMAEDKPAAAPAGPNGFSHADARRGGG